MAALTQPYPGTSASCLCPCLYVDGSGDGDDGGEPCPGSELAPAPLRTGRSQIVPDHTPPVQPPGDAAVSVRTPSVL